MKKAKLLQSFYLGLILIFTYVPIVSLVVFSFNDSKSLTQFTGFSLEWYQKLFEGGPLLDAIVVTLIVALISTTVSTMIGTLGAIALSKSRKTLKNVVLQANNLPIVNPEIVTAIAFLIFFGVVAIERFIQKLHHLILICQMLHMIWVQHPFKH